MQLLAAASPADHGISRVIVWGSRRLLAQAPVREWLERAHQPLLDEDLVHRTYWRARALSRLAASRCDVLFVPGGGYLGSYRPYVTVFQNALPFDPRERRRYGASWEFVRNKALRVVQGRSFLAASGVVFLSETARTLVMRATGELPGRTTIIPHGLDRRFFFEPRPQRPIAAYSDARPFRLLYVSKVDVYKHQWHVADAVVRLREDGYPVSLDLIGPSYGPSLRRLLKTMRSRDPAGETVWYHGEVPFEELPSRYLQADAFIFASTCENLPNILLEAMAAGLPIVCLRRDPMPEILGDAATFFESERPESIEAALAECLRDVALRTSHARRAQERAQAYSWTRCASDTLAFISSVRPQ
jgi:glycosyltransferase involved in cell wall biosynthesis